MGGETKESEELVQAIRNAVAISSSFATGKVKEVDAQNFTCDVAFDNDVADMPSVRLKAVIDNKDFGLIEIPKVDSEVIIFKLTTSQWVVIKTSELDSIHLKIGENTLKINSDGFTFNGGELDGLVKVNELVQKLNAIENKVNDLIAHYKTHNHAHPNGPTTAFVSPFTGSNLTLTQKNNLENPLIKQ